MRTMLAALVLSVILAGSASADTWVAGHYTRSGRWVEGHWRHGRAPALRGPQRSSYGTSLNNGPRATSYKPVGRPPLPSSYRRPR